MIKKLCKCSDNLLSFLCGIFSSIPLTLLFTIATTKWGNNWMEHTYFLVWLFAFIVSIFLTICVFSFTLSKMEIQKEIDSVHGGREPKNTRFNNIFKNKESDDIEKVKRKLKISSFIFIICSVILLCSLVAIWILNNFYI